MRSISHPCGRKVCDHSLSLVITLLTPPLATVLKTANARKDKLGPHWKNWVGKAVHRLVRSIAVRCRLFLRNDITFSGG
jgi:hypothetical protein